MEVSDSIVVMNEGRIEQTGSPQDLYDHPVNPFVMGFIGQVNRLGAGFIRPHDVEILLYPADGAEPAVVERVVHLGFEVRANLRCNNGETVHAQLTREDVRRLGLHEGQQVFVALDSARVFDRTVTAVTG